MVDFTGLEMFSYCIICISGFVTSATKALCSRVVRLSGHYFHRRQLWLLRQHSPTDELIIYTNIQPPRQKFFTKGQGQKSRSKIQKNVLLMR